MRSVGESAENVNGPTTDEDDDDDDDGNDGDDAMAWAASELVAQQANEQLLSIAAPIQCQEETESAGADNDEEEEDARTACPPHTVFTSWSGCGQAVCVCV